MEGIQIKEVNRTSKTENKGSKQKINTKRCETNG